MSLEGHWHQQALSIDSWTDKYCRSKTLLKYCAVVTSVHNHRKCPPMNFVQWKCKAVHISTENTTGQKILCTWPSMQTAVRLFPTDMYLYVGLKTVWWQSKYKQKLIFYPFCCFVVLAGTFGPCMVLKSSHTHKLSQTHNAAAGDLWPYTL